MVRRKDPSIETLDQTLKRRTTVGAEEIWEPLEGGRVRCVACGHRCVILKDLDGICRVRFNSGGSLRVPRGYVAVARPESGLAPELVETPEFAVLFEGPHDIERWDVRCRHGSVEVGEWGYGGAPEAAEGEAPAKAGDRFVILSVRRGEKVQPMHAKLKVVKGDIAAIAVHSMERDEAAHTGLQTKDLNEYKIIELIKDAGGDTNLAQASLLQKIFDDY